MPNYMDGCVQTRIIKTEKGTVACEACDTRGRLAAIILVDDVQTILCQACYDTFCQDAHRSLSEIIAVGRFKKGNLP